MEAVHRPISRDDIFDGRGEEMAVVRQTCRERRAIIEGITWSTLREFDLSVLLVSTLLFPHRRVVEALLTWRSKAFKSRHRSSVASSSFGKSMDMAAWCQIQLGGLEMFWYHEM
jgi:hypothetical protein